MKTRLSHRLYLLHIQVPAGHFVQLIKPWNITGHLQIFQLTTIWNKWAAPEHIESSGEAQGNWYYHTHTTGDCASSVQAHGDGKWAKIQKPSLNPTIMLEQQWQRPHLQCRAWIMPKGNKFLLPSPGTIHHGVSCCLLPCCRRRGISSHANLSSVGLWSSASCHSSLTCAKS